eukprot:185736-Rhodomonas_salina.1
MLWNDAYLVSLLGENGVYDAEEEGVEEEEEGKEEEGNEAGGEAGKEAESESESEPEGLRFLGDLPKLGENLLSLFTGKAE